MKLSIIIVNYNVRHFLEQAIYAAEKAIKNMDAEILVVDNNSQDDSIEMMETVFPHITCITNKDNPGFSKANNQAMKIAKGEYFLLLNPDTLVAEDTFEKCCDYLDKHPKVGGLGIKMIDGKGIYLPESKRGLPSPMVAFYKIFGLSALFPKSKKFGKYHLSYLDKNENHQIEVLSGAFMMMRKTALDKCGLLDEDFFMYGEDVDLSYRIELAGFENVYFADSQIIHYKGESTKKGSINYVFVFYKAMILFAKKHFQKTNSFLFQWAIYLAIYLRAFLALAKRFFQKFTLPIIDASVLTLSFVFIKNYWEANHLYILGGEYPSFLLQNMLPVYIGIWMLGLFFSRTYHKTEKIISSLRGIAMGSIGILVFYSLLPESLRTSRALILLTSLAGGVWLFLSRTFFQLRNQHKNHLKQGKNRILILSTADDYKQILQKKLLSEEQSYHKVIHEKWSVKHIKNTINTFQINQVLFSNSLLSHKEIIALMEALQPLDLEFKIKLQEKDFILGSNSIHRQGDVITDMKLNLAQKEKRSQKRQLDFVLSLVLLLISPLLFLWMNHPVGFIKNIFFVLFGDKTWIGYLPQEETDPRLPKIKEGIIHHAIANENWQTLKPEEKKELNFLYAKDYSSEEDFSLLLKNLKKLGTES